MDDDGRDIDLVVVTGAGASTAFGKDGGRLPMMAEWSDLLVRALAAGGRGHLAATGLDTGLSGPEFEERLGAFLRSVLAFQQIRPLLGPSLQLQANDRLTEETLLQWHHATARHLERTTELVHETLYENFGLDALNLEGAVNAYQELFLALGVGRRSSVVYATTNYDVLAEYAFERLGFHPDWGEVPQLRRSQSLVHVEDLLDGLPRYLPVLHLHGRVGWYRRREDDLLLATEGLAKYGDFGVPLVMLPDPDKEYDSDPAIQAIWLQFENALKRARKVLVLGHSLHDAALVDALRRHVQPTRRLAVTALHAEQRDDPGQEMKDLVDAEFSGARLIRLQFQPQPIVDRAALDDWLGSLQR